MRRGRCTLKELIDQFYIIEERYLCVDYRDGLRLNFESVCEKNKETIDELGRRPCTLVNFFKYAAQKKVRFK